MKKKFMMFGIISSILFTSYIMKEDVDKYHLTSKINISLLKNDPFRQDHKQAIDKLFVDNYSSINLNPVFFQQNPTSSNIEKTSQFTIDHMIDLIDYAQSRGLEVSLRPLINNRDGTSRKKILPGNVQSWFDDYSKIISEMVQIRSKTKSKDPLDIYVGSELDDLLMTYPDKFTDLIHSLRDSGFEGKIIYSTIFNYDEDTLKIQLLNKLPVDIIGIDFYVSMGKSTLPDSMAFMETKYYLDKIFSTSEKPVEFTELGYRSVDNGDNSFMYDYAKIGKLNLDLQKKSYEKFLKALSLKKFMNDKNIGVSFWITDNYSYAKDILKNKVKTGYSFFNKPAEKVVKDFNRKRMFIKYYNK